MAGISIDFTANVTKFIGGTKDVSTALAGVSDSLDEMARDAVQAGEKAERGLQEIEAKDARDKLRLLAAEARDAGSDMELVFSSAADEIDAELRAMATGAERHLEDISDAAKDAGKDLDKGLTDGTKDAETAAEKLERTFKETFDSVGTQAKKASSDVSTETKRGFKDAEDATSTFKDEARQNLSESVSSFRGDVEDIPQLLQDVLGGVSSDLGVMGGLAAAGVAAAIGVTIAKLQEHADKVNEAKESMGQLAREIADADGNLAEIDFASRMRDWAFEIKDTRSWFEVWQKDAVNNLETVAKAADGAGEDLSTFWQAMASPDSAKAREYLEQIQDRLSGVKTELDDALVSQGQVNGATAGHIDALTDERNALENLLDPLRKEVEAKENAYEQSVILRAAEEGVTGEVIKQRDAILLNNAAIAESNDLKNEAIDVAGEAFLAEGEYTTSVQDATSAIEENNKKIKENGEGHADNAKLVQDNREQIVGIAGDSRTYAQSMADAGSTQEEVNAILQRGREDFLRAAEAAGIGADEANALATQLGLVPNSVETEVKVKIEGLTGVQALEQSLNRINGKNVSAYVATKQTGQGYLNSGGTVPRKAASGSYVTGQGSDIDDRVPYMLSPGESVLDAQTTRQLGGPGIIDRLNNGQPVPGVGQTVAPTPARIDPQDLQTLVRELARVIETRTHGATQAAYDAATRSAAQYVNGQAVLRR